MKLPPQEKGFSFFEVLVAVGVISLALAGAYAGMLHLNEYAMVTRLYTAAQTKAKEQINHVLSAGPFNLKHSPAVVPGVLELGPTASTTVVYIDPNESSVKTLLSGTNTQATLPSNKALVTGTMTTIGEDFQISAGSTNALLRRIDVIINYEYRGRPYKVELSTIRSSDL